MHVMHHNHDSIVELTGAAQVYSMSCAAFELPFLFNTLKSLQLLKVICFSVNFANIKFTYHRSME